LSEEVASPSLATPRQQCDRRSRGLEAKPVFWSPGAVQAEAKALLKARNTLQYIFP